MGTIAMGTGNRGTSMDAGTADAGSSRSRTKRRGEDDPLSWWRSRDPSTITPAQSLKLFFRVRNASLQANLNAVTLETSRLVCLAIEGHPDRDLVLSHLYLKALEGHPGAVTVLANSLRREGAVCARLSAAWADRLVSSPRLLPAPRSCGPEA